MRVLVTWGSKRGGTMGIGETIADTLCAGGIDVVAMPVEKVKSLDGFAAVIVGGALYANLWPAPARRFINRNLDALRRVPVWMFSSGPLDRSADEQDIPPTRSVAILAERVGALGHVTFGGRLEPTATGFPARAMAKKHSGDWRNAERIREWAMGIAHALPAARPGAVTIQPGASWTSLGEFAVTGWAVCAALMALLLLLTTPVVALWVHGIAAPLVFVSLASVYFSRRGAHEPLPTAFVWTAIVIALDAIVVAGLVQRSFTMFASVAGTWLPLTLVFTGVWVTGYITSVMPEAATKTLSEVRPGSSASSSSR